MLLHTLKELFIVLSCGQGFREGFSVVPGLQDAELTPLRVNTALPKSLQVPGHGNRESVLEQPGAAVS